MTPEKVDAAGHVLHHEQPIQPLEQQRVDTEEVCGQNAPGLPAHRSGPGDLGEGHTVDPVRVIRGQRVADDKPGDYAGAFVWS